MQTGITDRQAARRPPRRLLDRQGPEQGLPCQGAGLQQVLIAARKNDFTAVLACLGPYIDDMVGNRDDIRIMFHHKDCIALVTQLLQQVIHPVDIPGMHSCTGFVKNISHSGQAAAHIPDKLQALRLPAGQRRSFTVQVEIGQADFNHPVQPLYESLHQQINCRLRDFCQDLPQLCQLHPAHVRNGKSVYPAVQGSRIQPLAVTVVTFCLSD